LLSFFETFYGTFYSFKLAHFWIAGRHPHRRGAATDAVADISRCNLCAGAAAARQRPPPGRVTVTTATVLATSLTAAGRLSGTVKSPRRRD